MPNEVTDGERMTKVETQLENIVMVVTRMDTKIDEWQKNFVSKELMDEKMKGSNKEIERLGQEIKRLDEEKAEKEELEKFEREKNTSKHTWPNWALVVVTLIMFLYGLYHK